MTISAMAMQLARIVDEVETPDDLVAAMTVVAQELGFRHFALTHHVDFASGTCEAMRIHNYPESWAAHYDRLGLGVSDPIHRASHMTSLGFCWSRVSRMIALTPTDIAVLELGRMEGISEGFTVPAHVPGEARGSCTFAGGPGQRVSDEMVPAAQLAGNFAFEAARRLWIRRGGRAPDDRPVLTDRQRDCAIWVARGKGDWEIAKIMGLSEATVAQHVRQACERYQVNKRTSRPVAKQILGNAVEIGLRLLDRPVGVRGCAGEANETLLDKVWCILRAGTAGKSAEQAWRVDAIYVFKSKGGAPDHPLVGRKGIIRRQPSETLKIQNQAHWHCCSRHNRSSGDGVYKAIAAPGSLDGSRLCRRTPGVENMLETCADAFSCKQLGHAHRPPGWHCRVIFPSEVLTPR